MGKQRSNRITLRGRVVFSTDKAVRWLDESTGYELWFPLSVVRINGDTIHVPERMYRENVRKWEREERKNERENARQDREGERQLRRDLREIDRQYGKETKPAGCATMMLLALILFIAYRLA